MSDEDWGEIGDKDARDERRWHMSEPHTIPPNEPLGAENDPTGRWRIAELEAKLEMEAENRTSMTARIVALEAELAGLQFHRDSLLEELDEAKAELDALKDGISRRTEQAVAADTQELYEQLKKAEADMDLAYAAAEQDQLHDWERSRTHWEECWRVHPTCAVARVVALEAELEALKDVAEPIAKRCAAAESELKALKAELAKTRWMLRRCMKVSTQYMAEHMGFEWHESDVGEALEHLAESWAAREEE
jgi:chromosome segregation ATPase